jgi:hypothetical protein
VNFTGSSCFPAVEAKRLSLSKFCASDSDLLDFEKKQAVGMILKVPVAQMRNETVTS